MAVNLIPQSARDAGYHMGKSGDGAPILAVVRTPLPKPDANGRYCVGVDGKWYDVRALLETHPGGDIIKEFVGRDASEFFHIYHQPYVLKHRAPCGEYDPAEIVDQERWDSGAEKEFRALITEFQRDGWYITDMKWFASKLLVIAGFLALAFLSALLGPQNLLWYCLVTAPSLALFWQQCGFLMHDTMHSQIFQNPKIDRKLGSFFGTVCLGVSGHWWRDEHFEHHTFTNTFEEGVLNTDPQMQEVIWVQDSQLRQFFLPLIQKLVIPFQHWFFLPILIFVGRFGIMIDSMISERRPREWALFGLHWVWVSMLLSLLPDWRTRAIFYYASSCFQGVLHIQLLISHYDKPFVPKPDAKAIGVFERQARAVKDVHCPRWLDWFHGGLNLHMAHHLFPRLPRHRLAPATERVRQVCVKYGIPIDNRSWTEAIWDCIEHLRSVSTLKLTLDIRK